MIVPYYNQQQRKIIFETRLKLNHNVIVLPFISRIYIQLLIHSLNFCYDV